MEEGNVAVARVKVKVEVMKGALQNDKSRRLCLPREENCSTVCEKVVRLVCIPWWW